MVEYLDIDPEYPFFSVHIVIASQRTHSGLKLRKAGHQWLNYDNGGPRYFFSKGPFIRKI